MDHLRRYTPPKHAVQNAARPGQQYQHLGLYIKGGLDDALAMRLVLHQVGGGGSGRYQPTVAHGGPGPVQATSATKATTSRPLAKVWQKGIIPITLARPMSRRTRRRALHSSRKSSRYCGL